MRQQGLGVDEQLAGALLEEVPDALVVVDADGRIQLVNRGFEELFGYEPAEVLGQPVEMLVPDALRSRHRGHQARYQASPHRRPMGRGLELEGQRRDGSLFPVEISLSPLERDGGGTLTIAAIRDISERLEAEHALTETLQRLALSEDRERIARDLHDKVIQRLFATGLVLQAAATHAESDSVLRRLHSAIDDLDEAIREIRTSIFALHEPSSAEHESLRAGVLSKVNEASRVLGFSPSIQFAGPVDTLASAAISDALLATLQEALSNVVRHASAHAVSVEVRAGDNLELRVRDDGVGLDAGAISPGDGLRNMERRVRALGGTLTIARAEPAGTELTWSVPLSGCH